MASTRSTANYAVAAMVVAMLCLGAAKLSAACDGGEPCQPTSLLPPLLPSPPAPTAGGKCPMNVVKLGVCASVLEGLIGASVGKAAPPKAPCCPLIAGLVDVDAAVCVCLAIKADVLGVKLNIPVDLSLLVNYCGRKVPDGFHCA
ncbi:hypothetical protein GUJ93_ZPchr0008g14059 [Zizania palustris]|uniref:Bifunctional inhibitor/plant lipid transfer protein/seed storage helical domain-containing protein n=1 Tax=Zizania palustris TaxID=103762 RepID=A0A8J5RJV7_ZIZPA|nr:hypothetical protein GUJ93_ZPchr0008g14059 [Zizania palustris]